MIFITLAFGPLLRGRRRTRTPQMTMTAAQFTASIASPTPPAGLSAPLLALWYDARGDWASAHAQVDDLETREGMAVHAYLHRKEGSAGNADYWYARSTIAHRRPTLDAEYAALLESLLR
jgi:hypothetical protein